MLSDIYEDDIDTGEDFRAEYRYIFSKDADSEWKLEVTLFHE